MHSFPQIFAVADATTHQTHGLSQWVDPLALIHYLGPWLLVGMFIIIFCEVSIPFGVFFPGDSLLFTTGLLASTGKIKEPLWLICIVLTLAADLGGHLGYYLGKKAGPSLINNPKSRWIKPEYMKKSHDFFEKRGGSALILSRFVAVVRTFASSFAGISEMNYRKFATYNLISAIIWCVGIPLAGFYLGKFAWVRHNIEFIFLGIVAIVLIAISLEVIRSKKESTVKNTKI